MLIRLKFPATLLLGATSLFAQNSSDTLTWHNNNNRTGANAAETTLTLTNVNAGKFGQVFFFPTDGIVDAQPLYVSGLTIGGVSHHVVFIATEHGTVYAMVATTGKKLWQTSLLQAGETNSDNRHCDQIEPEIGITATPVIDRSKGPNGAIYVVNMAEDSNGNYRHRLNALDLATGAQLFGGPQEITATFSVGDTKVTFAPSRYSERVGLLEWQGGIYTAWTSHCDDPPYNGWIIGYDASTLKKTTVLNVTPNGSDGAVWMAGAGLAATDYKMFFLDANGTFDTTLDSNGFPIKRDFGNAFIQLQRSPVGELHVTDYYATDNTVAQSDADTDFGSGGVLVLPALMDADGNVQHLAVGAGKDTNIYVVNRDDMGKYHPSGGFIYQLIPGALPHGEWGAPAYFDKKIYYGGVNDNLKAFSVAKARVVTTPVSLSAMSFGYPGTTPVISSNGTANGIVWAIRHTTPAILYAFNAEDLSQELYDSNQSGTRDQFGAVDHFISPTVAGGRVYLPIQAGVSVFGLLGD